MRTTCILEPLEDDLNIEADKKEQIKHQWEKIEKYLYGMNMGENVSFEEYLSELELSEEEYVAAVRASILKEYSHNCTEGGMIINNDI